MNIYDQTILDTAVSMNIPVEVAKNMVLQARYETADYSSPAFKKNNNAFGYKYIGQTKWPTGAGIQSSEGDYPYANYSSLQKSVGEMVDWLNRRQKEGSLTISRLTDLETYAVAIHKPPYVYSGQSGETYGAGLLAKLKNVDWGTVAKEGGISIGVIAMIVGVFLFFKSKNTI